MNNTKNKINNPKNKTIKRITQKGMTWFTIVLSGSKGPSRSAALKSDKVHR